LRRMDLALRPCARWYVVDGGHLDLRLVTGTAGYARAHRVPAVRGPAPGQFAETSGRAGYGTRLDWRRFCTQGCWPQEITAVSAILWARAGHAPRPEPDIALEQPMPLPPGTGATDVVHACSVRTASMRALS